MASILISRANLVYERYQYDILIIVYLSHYSETTDSLPSLAFISTVPTHSSSIANYKGKMGVTLRVRSKKDGQVRV